LTPDFAGPSVLLIGPPNDEARRLAVRVISHYSRADKLPSQPIVSCRVGVPREEGREPMKENLPLENGLASEELERMRI
jgi:hypothetical protein